MQRDGHYPHQSSIDAYGNGGFRFADMSHKGSLLCLPTGMHAWKIDGPEQIDTKTLAPVLALSEKIDVLFIGLGEDIAFVDPELRQVLREHSIIIEAVGTGSAVRTYNIMLAEGRSVAAALIAVERAKTADGRMR